MNLEALKTQKFDPIAHRYDERATMLYALSVGASRDPLDPADLRFTYEKDLVALPTMASTLSSPGLWMREPRYEIDWVKLLHGEQAIELHAPLPAKGTVDGHNAVVAVKDKGAGKGATLYCSRILKNEDGEPLVTIRSTYVLRGDGGCGDLWDAPEPLSDMPDRALDHVLEIATLDNQALLYRLNGDMNPIHSDPDIARSGGFDRPIMHGLGTMGMACHALVRAFCDGDPTRVATMSQRFSKPFYPGETMLLECIEEPGMVRFRAKAKERDVVILDLGTLALK